MPKFKLHMSRLVEQTATIEVDAASLGCAMGYAILNADRAEWSDGDGGSGVEVYSIQDEAGDEIWTR